MQSHGLTVRSTQRERIAMFRRVWRRLKIWRRIAIGPIALTYSFDRAVRTTAGTLLRVPFGAISGQPGLEACTGPDTAKRLPASKQLALVVGVGEGFGFALARQLALDGFDLVLVSRGAERLQPLLVELHALGVTVESYGADATDESSVDRLFDHVCAEHGVPTLVVYSVQGFGPGLAIEIDVPAFESSWRHNCLGAFLVGRCAAKAMLSRGSGTIVFIGSASSLVGRAGHLNLAVGKFGQRAIAQVMARELWPRGIHVAHAMIDAEIDDGSPCDTERPQANPNHIATAIVALHQQPKTAWTSELDLRPWNETFWEHC
jgi:NAD(P)-dependent dehydrogenase (short-subunit alcohol dehydrogenase family)